MKDETCTTSSCCCRKCAISVIFCSVSSIRTPSGRRRSIVKYCLLSWGMKTFGINRNPQADRSSKPIIATTTVYFFCTVKANSRLNPSYIFPWYNSPESSSGRGRRTNSWMKNTFWDIAKIQLSRSETAMTMNKLDNNSPVMWGER